jgi:hypothetical protein
VRELLLETHSVLDYLDLSEPLLSGGEEAA